MKRILGLDLGTTSIGWALVNEKENPDERSSIVKLGVRLVPLENFTNGEGKQIKMKISDAFASGVSVSTKAARRKAKSARVNNARYKQRRDQLKKIFIQNGWIGDDTPLCEEGKDSTFTTLRLRAKAVSECISLEELARVLLMINKKRGYKSNRKLRKEDEGEAIDGMHVAYKMYENNLTPGQYVNMCCTEGKFYIPQFYPSDLRNELKQVWSVQKSAYPELTDDVYLKIDGCNEKATWAILAEALGLKGIKRDGKKQEQKRENYAWRAKAAISVLDKEQLAIVLSCINHDIHSASGYLGGISDRSKLLYFKKQTIGQYLLSIVDNNRHTSLKKRVFYREDYLNEFEKIWETQAMYHPELTEELKNMVRNECIFYQRPLKSQKHNVDFCTLESYDDKVVLDGKEVVIRKGLRVCPKSSPLYQEFKVWQGINNLEITDRFTYEVRELSESERNNLFAELNMTGCMKKSDIFRCLSISSRRYNINFDELPGNSTREVFYRAYLKMLPATGHTEIDEKKVKAVVKESVVRQVFEALGFNTDILDDNKNLCDGEFDKHASYQLWHLLYSSDGTNLNDRLVKLCKFGEYTECAQILSSVSFANDYGNLSAKALRKILPYMRKGMKYSEACKAAGYNHSVRSYTKEENEKRELLDRLPEYNSGALRNPVVDKVLAQLTNVVNCIIDEYGRPDEVRVEMAREMKNNSKERERISKTIKENASNAERISKLLKDEFGFAHPTRKDIVRWRLYEELKFNGYRTLYSNTYIRREDVFSKMYDIEHIIPQARLFDDSFANKTLELTSVNQEKASRTAYDYMTQVCAQEDLDNYVGLINSAFVDGHISKTKRNYLLMKQEDIPSDFIQRDLRETQYITRKAMEMLENVVRTVIATTGRITDFLREEWQLVDVMKELNIPTYELLGLVRRDKNHESKLISRIEGWSKRSDHRHHAMDALTVAFTKRSAVQYLNTLNANCNAGTNKRIEAPMPVNELREETRKALSDILISVRSSKKVTTTHCNKATGQVTFTPRGALHAETYYGSIKRSGEIIYTARKEIDPTLDVDSVIDKRVREILYQRLRDSDNAPKIAFVALDNNPVWFNKEAGILIKKVTVRNKKVNAPIAVHEKRDHRGNIILDKSGNSIPTDFVAPDNNHHIAFYKDAKGKLHERTMTFYEAVERKRQGLEVFDKDYRREDGWKYLFSLQRGEYIVFPNEERGFSTLDIDMCASENKVLISPHLFIVQKLSKKNYVFRHHLDPTTDENPALKDINWKSIRNIPALNHIVKVRLNILGEIVESQLIEI